jgi:anionic cell wall polymer biosynthesis LytR-Cps2A-Psr (LCP) family protein
MSERLLVRLIQVFAVLAVAGLVFASAALGWIAHTLRDFSGDISTSHSRLPAAVPKVLPAEQNILDSRQVTLIRYGAGVSRGAAVLLFTVPDRNQVSFVTLPPSSRVGDIAIQRLAVPALVRGLDRGAGVRISHVALIDPAAVGPLVGRIGGVDVTNPVAFTAEQSGRTITFARGRMHLDAGRAGAFAHVATTEEPLEAASAALLAGIVHRLLQPTSVARARQVGSALAAAASTDLTDADVIGLVDLRLRGGTALQCLVPRRTALAPPAAASVLARADGRRPPLAGGGCSVRSVDAAAVTPPLEVVRLAQRYGWAGFAAGSLVCLLLAAAAAALLAWRWPRPRRQASIWRPLSVPQPGDDVVWWARRPPAAELSAPPPSAPERATEPDPEPAEQPSGDG